MRTLLLIAILSSSACMRYSGQALSEGWTALGESTTIADGEDDGQYARECAPEEYAMAQAHQEFARLEFRQGDPRRADQHLEIARANMEIAAERAEECRPRDSDGDGFMDRDDSCPQEHGGSNSVDGCPFRDSDGDGVADSMDECPSQREDLDGFMDADGCPDIDNDRDGLLDAVDQCPMRPEDINGFQDEDGCPEGVVDRDGDGILDDTDSCPDQPENINSYRDDDGCPDVRPQSVRITRDRILIDEKILFETNASRILSDSHSILDSVAQVMTDYPNIVVRIEGHTDSQGGDDFNRRLSSERAEAVFTYLVGRGIDMTRLETEGVGEARPIDTNRTSRGRANNRRVEFHIVE